MQFIINFIFTSFIYLIRNFNLIVFTLNFFQVNKCSYRLNIFLYYIFIFLANLHKNNNLVYFFQLY